MSLEEQILEIKKQILYLEKDKHADPELLSVLAELQECHTSLLKAQQELHSAVSNVTDEALSQVSRGWVSDADSEISEASSCLSDMCLSEDGDRQIDNEDSARKKPKNVKRRHNRRRLKPWVIMPHDWMLGDDVLLLLKQAQNSRDCLGQEAHVTRALWAKILVENLSQGQLVAFAQRKLNGEFVWSPGVIQDVKKIGEESMLNTTDRVLSNDGTYSGQGNESLKQSLNSIQCDNNMKLASDSISLESALITFAAPERVSQIPCGTFATTGYCGWGHKCRYSHGISVTPENIRPLFWDADEQLQINMPVLFLPTGEDIWESGTVQNINDTGVHIFDSNNNVVCVTNLNRILPKLTVEDFNGMLPGDATAIVDPKKEESITVEPISCNLSSDTLKSNSNDTIGTHNTEIQDGFGVWEKHTKGFGSRMLRKMGYKAGDPLAPPSWREGHTPRLTAPLPIRVLPTRVSLDFLNRGQDGKNGGVEIDFRRFSLQEFEEQQKKRKHLETTTGAFGLVNVAMNTTREGEADERQKQHQKELEATRNCKQSDEVLRKNLCALEQQLDNARSELKTLEENLSRHLRQKGSSKVQQLHALYASTVLQKQEHIKHLEEQTILINQKLNTNQTKTKLKIF